MEDFQHLLMVALHKATRLPSTHTRTCRKTFLLGGSNVIKVSGNVGDLEGKEAQWVHILLRWLVIAGTWFGIRRIFTFVLWVRTRAFLQENYLNFHQDMQITYLTSSIPPLHEKQDHGIMVNSTNIMFMNTSKSAQECHNSDTEQENRNTD